MRRAILLACALGALSQAPSASAQQPAGLVVIPHSASEPALSYLVLHTRAGRTARAGSIELLNPTSRPLRVALAPVDAETLDTLGSAYLPGGSRIDGATRWLRLRRHVLTLAPHARATTTVDVRVPRDARPGDYLSGVSIEALGQLAAERKVLARTATASVVRYAIGVETTLPGARRPLIRFTGATVRSAPAGLTFELDARNRGNVILQGVHGQVRIARGGRTVLSRTLSTGTFVAGTSIAYPVPAFGQHPPEGTRYAIKASLHYPGGVAYLDTTVTFGHRAAEAQRRFGGAPSGGRGDWWKVALPAAAILYGLITTILLLRRRRRDQDGQAAAAPSGAPGALDALGRRR